MNIQNQQFTSSQIIENSIEIASNHINSQQIANNQLNLKYSLLLKQYNCHKQTSTEQYQILSHQLEKYKTHNQNLTRKLQKKYQNLLHEQRIKSSKLKDKLQSQFQKQRQMYKEVITNKNKSLQNLSDMLRISQKQKTQIIEQNTINLIQIVKSQQNCLQMKKYSHTQLMKMYQYLLEENNCLKKQLMKVQSTENIQEVKNVQKTKRNNNNKGSSVFYTETSEQSKYVGVTNQNALNLKKNKSKSKGKQTDDSILINTLNIASYYQPKGVNANRLKGNNSQNKNKVNSSYQGNGKSSIIEQKNQKLYKKKDGATKPLVYLHNNKKNK